MADHETYEVVGAAFGRHKMSKAKEVQIRSLKSSERQLDQIRHKSQVRMHLLVRRCRDKVKR